MNDTQDATGAGTRFRGPLIDLSLKGRLWGGKRALAALIGTALDAAAKVLARDFQQQLIAIRLANDSEVRALNRDFRGKDKATNVLSFPDPDSVTSHYLGDIIMARETMTREAHEGGIPFEHHIVHLAVHGFLHCLGYDHILDEEAEEMERLETLILARVGIKDPYADGASAPDM